VSARAAEALGCRRVVLQGAGHSPNIEAPDQFVAALIAHLQ
jgi:pimeloyl-ACP methyl ester carboxylesterase